MVAALLLLLLLLCFLSSGCCVCFESSEWLLLFLCWRVGLFQLSCLSSDGLLFSDC